MRVQSSAVIQLHYPIGIILDSGFRRNERTGGRIHIAHEHNHEIHTSLAFDEKMVKLLEHWIRHNDDHSASYRDWSEKTKEKDMNDVGLLLE
ncbi:MAG: hypothetical protein KKC23_03725, partial [Proteobacteria bacterium]|nr:hypothetical protein [Pseudomonadota bacterium]